MWNDAKLLTESENNILLAQISTSRHSSHTALLAKFQPIDSLRKYIIYNALLICLLTKPTQLLVSFNVHLSSKDSSVQKCLAAADISC